MAARKKAAAKASRKSTRKAVAKAPASAKNKLASPKSPRASAAPAQRKKAAKAVAKAEKPVRQRALKADPQTETEALARRIVSLTTDDTAESHIAELYAEDVVSQEVDGRTVHGLEGIRAKFETWASMTESSSFTARHVLVHKNVIAIEWEGEVKLRDGRSLSLSEVAIHETRDGKITAERFYYDPTLFGPPPVEPEPEPLPPVKPPRGTPPLDPMDL